MLGSLALGSYAIAETLEDADVAVVNTCSFIESAREESIEAILEVADLKESGRLRAVVVAGCLPQRYGDALAKELPEVDLFVGTSHFKSIVDLLDGALAGRTGGVYVDAGETYLYDENDPRLLIGTRHSAYVKVAEGCDRVCAFCAIPGIRGKFQSRSIASIMQEAKMLAGEGVRELNLISQDTTSFGKDHAERQTLADLVRAFEGVDGIDWVRLLYLYPSALSDELVDAIAESSRVLPYIDVPLQHASDAVLKRMRRGVTRERQRALVERLRDRIENVVVRTTFIVGFPGETDADFEDLYEFVKDMRFDRVGAFRYSDEEGTTAETYAEKVPRELARERYHRLMELQHGILVEKQRALMGREVDVLVDRATAGFSLGRIWSQAPDVDGVVYLKGEAKVGALVSARVTGLRDIDLEAERVA